MRTFDLIGEVRRSYETETGEPMTRAAAAVKVDWMCDAFCHLVEGVGHEAAVRQTPDIARWLAWRWTGSDGAKLRAALDTVTPDWR